MDPEKFRRFLMNQADSSPGGGSAPASSPAQGGASSTTTPAAAAAPDIVGIVAAEVGKAMGELRNGLFADLRRTGALKDAKSNGSSSSSAAPTAETSSTSAAAPASGLSADDVKKLMSFQRQLGGAGLTSKQESQIEKLYELEKPGDVTTWLASTISDLGIGKGSAMSNPNQSAAAAGTNTTPQGRPVSDAGAPAGHGTPGGEPTLAKMSAADRLAWIAQHGHVAFRERLQREMKGVSVQLRPK